MSTLDTKLAELATQIGVARGAIGSEGLPVTQIGAPDGSGLVGFRQAGTGAVARNVADELRERVSVTQFGALGDGAFNSRAAIQNAVNVASHSHARTVVFPAGEFVSDGAILLHYDAVLNPGFNVQRNAEITFLGDGISSENGGACGTILRFTNTTGDSLIVLPAANDTAPYTGRDFRAVGMTITGGTSGYLMSIQGVPGARLHDVEIVQTNPAGNGLHLTTSYFGSLKSVRIQNRGSGTKTGDMITFGTSITAGLMSFSDVNGSGFANGLRLTTGVWQTMSIENSELAGSAYGILADGGAVDNLVIHNSYFEGACTSFIKDNAHNAIRSLVIVGGSYVSDGLTGPAIDLSAPNSVQIIGGETKNQNTTFLNIGELPSGGMGGYMVRGTKFSRSEVASEPVTLFTGMLPELHGIDFANSDPNVLLHAAAARPITSRTNYAGSSYFAAGHMLETSAKDFGAQAGATIDLQAEGYPAFVHIYNVTAAATFHLPENAAGLPHGYTCTVTNAAASTQSPVVKTATGTDGAITLGAIAPGQQRKFVFFNDGTTTGWK